MTRTPAFCRARTIVRIAAALTTAGRVAAQEPNVVGRVTGVGGLPVAGLEVSIDGTRLTAGTSTDGRFAIAGAPAGAQDVIVRGAGYLPARAAVRVPDADGSLRITVLAETPDVAAIADKGKAHLLAGVVLDASHQPVAGATVDVVGSVRQTVTTDSGGGFVVPEVRNGVAVYRVRKDGFFATHGAVRMFDRRGLVVVLDSLAVGMGAVRRAMGSNLNNNDEAAWRDAAQRIASRGARAVIMSAVDLAPYADRPIREALRQTKAGNAIMPDIQQAESRICVLADGNRPVGSMNLDTWLARDVEMLELYPPGTETSQTALRYLSRAGCAAEVDASGRVRPPFIAVVWLR